MSYTTRFFPKTMTFDPKCEPDGERVGETSGGGGEAEKHSPDSTASSGEREIQAVAVDGKAQSHDDSLMTMTAGGEESGRMALMEKPPIDDVCPICFGNFDVPCRAPCGHWYCGSCILQYWNFSAALQPCRCPMCSQGITKLTPEASLYHRHEVEISSVLQNVINYNRLFVGGISGLALKFRATPLYIKRIFREMLNPDRPGGYLHEMRVIALFLGVLYSLLPFDFLQIGRRNILDVFDYVAFGLSFILYLVGLYIRRRSLRNARELLDVQA